MLELYKRKRKEKKKGMLELYMDCMINFNGLYNTQLSVFLLKCMFMWQVLSVAVYNHYKRIYDASLHKKLVFIVFALS